MRKHYLVDFDKEYESVNDLQVDRAKSLKEHSLRLVSNAVKKGMYGTKDKGLGWDRPGTADGSVVAAGADGTNQGG